MFKYIIWVLYALALTSIPGLRAQAMDGIAYIASVRGVVTSSLTADNLKKGETLPAQQNTIRTETRAFTVIVLSNGLSIYCGPNSELILRQFTQQPFDETSNSLEYETSKSAMTLELSHGNFGFSHRIPIATSVLQLTTKYGGIEPHSRAFAITLRPNDAKLLVFEGSVRVQLDLRNGTELVQADQTMNLLSNAATHLAAAIQPVQAIDMRTCKPWVNMAGNIRQRTHFLAQKNGEIIARTLFPKEYFSRKAINAFEVELK